MAEKEKSAAEVSQERMFLASEVIPDAAGALLDPLQPLSKIKDKANVVLDASALLLPYTASSGSLQNITALYKKLVLKRRLFIPAQAAREFLRNGPNKISELQQGFLDKMSRFETPDVPSYPIFAGLPEYEALLELLGKANEIRREFRKSTNALVDAIRAWEWNDPVSTAYRTVLTRESIVEVSDDPTQIRAELLRRYELSIPPGYKDNGKPDGGIGDYLIWKTILQIGAKDGRPVIFVSGDEKADWQYSSKGAAFLPRIELLAEFRKLSNGQSFHMIPLSKLLELYEGESTSVAELQHAEELLSEENVIVDCPNCHLPVRTRLALASGSSALPFCENCRKKFHVNRRRDEVVVRVMGQPDKKLTPSAPITEGLEIAFCPNCASLVEFWLGDRPGSARWVSCEECKAEFPVRRAKDQNVVIGSVQLSSEVTKNPGEASTNN